MKKPGLILWALLLTQAASWAQTAPRLTPPPTRKDTVVTRYHGVDVADPYRWLEDGDSPEVKTWIETQNRYAEEVLARFPEGKVLTERVQALALTSTQQSAPRLAGRKLFYLRQIPPEPQPVLVVADWPRGEARVLLDPNDESGGGRAVLDFWPSPGGTYVAYGTAEGGSEMTTIQVLETATGKLLPDALPHAGGGTTPQALVWDGDEKGVTYVRLPLPGTVPDDQLQFGAALYHHVLGAPAKEDRLVFGGGLSPVAEYARLSLSEDGRHAAALVHFGDGSPQRVYLRTGDSWKLALGPEVGVRAGGDWDDRRLLVIACGESPRGRVLAVAPDGTSRTLVPEDSAWAMQAVHPIRGGLLVTRVKGPDWRLDHYDDKGLFVRTVPLPKTGIAIGEIASSPDSDQALVAYVGWTVPDRWALYDGALGTQETIFSVEPPGDYSRVRATRFEATSRDGTRIPVTVLAMDSTAPDAERPTILYGYGGFGLAMPPRFLGPMLAWLENGGVYAVANVRGGTEFGEDWHQNGRLGKKQNVFEDFYAASRGLIDQGWTSTARLGIQGGSNGGLLVGALLTQHPDQFRAVVGFVGVYEMLRYELWPNGTYNISEFGTVTRPDDFRWLYAYSPVHRVRAGENYPSVLLETGENDTRVAPWQSRKLAAALQAATASGLPALLVTRTNAGHGQGASFSQRVGRTALALTFFAHELGLQVRDPASR
ncbi:MAG: S9 family peptidase [Armatimonadetes bacterium]|nr:S9 family peptidase [Armatimonadota bacterium]